MKIAHALHVLANGYWHEIRHIAVSMYLQYNLNKNNSILSIR